VKGDIDDVNSKFSRVENIRKFRIFTKQLDHDDEELTATQKVKRANIINKFSDVVEEIYR
jgi:long-chain acyl-CoA synthetase